MTTTEIIIAIVGVLVILTGVFNLGINTRKNRLLVKLIGETGMRVLVIVLGAFFTYLAIFTDYFIS